MIIEVSRMPKCTMLKVIRYLVLVDIDILVLLRIYLELRKYIVGRCQQLQKKLQHKLGNVSMSNTLVIHS
jgi:hypothetical protein